MKRIQAILASLLIGLALSQAAHAGPDTLVQQVVNDGQTITMRLTKQNLRGSHFELWAQNATGAYDVITPVEERSYLGTVDGFPDAIASGIVQDDGVFRGAVVFDRGGTWFTLGNAVQYTRGIGQPANYGMPGWKTTPGQAGKTMYGFNVGIDASYNYFNVRAGGNIARAFEYIEFSVAATRALYMQDVLARPYLARVILRTDLDQDPAKGKGGGVYLDAVRSEWNNNQQDASREVVAGLSANSVGGGLAWVGVIATSSAYSVSDSGGDGEFTIVWRHELGHNWGLGHYDGGAAEGGTINSDNKYARMSGSELSNALNHRNSRLGRFTNEGTYTTVPIPPYASMDSATITRTPGVQAVIDVLANDHDANGESLTLVSAPSTSAKGGTVLKQGQRLIYIPRGDFSGVDSFTYLIQDAGGQTATGAVAVDVQLDDRLRLYMPLDETIGTAVGDFSVYRNTGKLTGADLTTASGPGKYGNAVTFDGVDDYVSASGVKLTSNTVTITAWIKPAAAQAGWAGIVFDRSSTVSGINLTPTGELRYHWNNSKYDWNSHLTPAIGVWTFVVLVVEPGKATMYMNDGSGFQSAVNTGSHSPATFGTVNIGRDPDQTTRFFNGAIDEARIYGKSLNVTELQTVANGGAAEGPSPSDGSTNIGPISLSWAPSAVAVSYRVYLGTDAAVVAAATDVSAEYLGEVTSPAFVNPPTVPSATNYWRVDVETATGTITGPLWTFTRSGVSNMTIGNFSFENGVNVHGVPNSWTYPSTDYSKIGIKAGGSDGANRLFIGPGAQISQDLNHVLIAGETLTLKYDFEGSRTYGRNIQMLAKNSGGVYTLMAESTSTAGSGGWPTVTFNYTVAAGYPGQQLALRIISSNWNEFDNFRITSAAPAGPANNLPVFTTDPITLPGATSLISYNGNSLANSATDADNDPLTYGKLSGPAWLTVAADGTLTGTPGAGDVGLNSFLVRVADAAGGVDFADATIAVTESGFFYDTNDDSPGSGANAENTWDGSAKWTSDPNGEGTTFAWVNNGTAIFSAGSDASGDYTIDNTAPRIIGGFTARSGTPRITGSELQPVIGATPFRVEATAEGAIIDAPLKGAGGMVKSGPGTLVLGGNNTFTGDITIEEGVLQLASTARLYNGSYTNIPTLTVGSGGTWRLPDYSYTGTGKLANYAQRRVLDGGVIEVTGNSQSSEQDFMVTTAGGTFRYTTPDNTLTLAGNTSSNISTAGVLVFDAIGNITVSGTSSIIGGGGSILKLGGGNLTLGNGGNKFAGDVTVSAGKLLANVSAVAPNSALGAVNGNRVISANASGSIEWTANNILAGKSMTAANIPTVQLDGSSLKATRYNAIGNLILAGATLENAVTTDPVNFDGFQFIGKITANGEAQSSILTTTGHGNHLLGGGTTEISVTDPAGRLAIGTILRNGSDDYPGTANLKKTGPGTLALAAANTYSGVTTIEEGTLELKGSLNSPTTVNAGGQLSGNGMVIAAVTVDAGGTLAPATDATLTTGALTLAADSTLVANGKTSIIGNVSLAGAQLNIAIPSERVLLTYLTARSGEFATAGVPAGWEIEYDDDAKEIRLIETPPAAGYNSWIGGFATGGNSGFTQDADHDGFSNGLEFLLGGDPLVSGDTPAPVFAAAPEGEFTYTFTRAARARGACTVIAKLSEDMVTWPQARDIPVGMTSGPGVAIVDQIDHDEITIQLPNDALRTFIRLEVRTP